MNRRCKNPACGAWFTPPKDHLVKVYCSRRCANTVHNKARAAERGGNAGARVERPAPLPALTQTCPICGGPMPPKNAARQVRAVCSVQCARTMGCRRAAELRADARTRKAAGLPDPVPVPKTKPVPKPAPSRPPKPPKPAPKPAPKPKNERERRSLATAAVKRQEPPPVPVTPTGALTPMEIVARLHVLLADVAIARERGVLVAVDPAVRPVRFTAESIRAFRLWMRKSKLERTLDAPVQEWTAPRLDLRELGLHVRGDGA